MARRKRRWGRWTLGLGIAVLAAGMAGAARADEEEPSRMTLRLRKLGRGAANMATAPVELLRMPELVMREDGYVAGLTVGVVQGVWRTLLREVIGIMEVTTFYAEIPEGFAPLIKPEFLLAYERQGEPLP